MKWDRAQHTLKPWGELTGNHLEGDCGRGRCPDGQGSGSLARYRYEAAQQIVRFE